MDDGVMLGRCGRMVPAMTRCECAEITFDELVRRMKHEGATLDAVQDQTGVGLLCTACLPDLRDHLDSSTEAHPPVLAAAHEPR